ncbi:YceG family protein [Leptospira fainei serovar Hurstbridge str. BUT 6]|uniref:Endolytic murein transglycosylase n=1 Tax=Leptospira fainei serovar Hurstbridge str. BUT 6 TaxID=1193011 RepID=S3V9Q7_9LEPT|nr:endolytic transglycosylase MltG [Leptospira fainei]EPG73155.1 YceG family protein [Leptospira fainei serovar Hurstbridge str. BUT 6]
MNSMNKILLKLGAVVFGLILLSVLAFFIADEMKGGATGAGQVKIDLSIEPGDSPAEVTATLAKNGLLKSSKYFLFLIKVTRSANKIKAGLYEINDGMDSRKILQVITEGKVKLVTFTVPEGYNNRQIGDLLVKKNLIKTRADFLNATSRTELLREFKIPASTAEGYLFPETYSVPVNYPVDKIARMMLKRFFAKLEKLPKAKELDPKKLHEIVVLASVVEREAKKNEERPLMAGVFLNRMKKDIPLESCATIQYLFDKPHPRIFEKDLKIVSPYNTYLNKGYPPGPISNPGLPALEAALVPTQTEYLFFLLKPDGYHFFSKNFKEHAEAKKKYIDVLYE